MRPYHKPDFKKPQKYCVYGFSFLLLFTLQCVPLTKTTPDKRPIERVSNEDQKKTAEPIAARGPNEIIIDSWQMPPQPSRTPSFPYLPGEDQTISRSIGNISFGHLVSARAIQYPHPTISMLSVHAGRNLIYTSDPMVELVEAAALFVKEKYPDTITFVGNFSAVGGGDIPYSVSHNNGRDADLAFFMTDDAGTPVEPPNLLPLDDEGKHETDSGDVYHFDVERNWALIHGLIENGKTNLQLILISGPLKKMLLDYAKETKQTKYLQKRADALLLVPRSALPHDDHFHIRIRCSDTDVESGCSGQRTESQGIVLAAAIKKAETALANDDATVRTMAVRRLSILGSAGSSKAIESLASDDKSALVRAAANRSLGEIKKGYKTLRANLAREENANVRSEILWSLSTSHSKSNARAISKFLDKPQLGTLNGSETIDLRRIAIDTLVEFESKLPVATLIKLVGSEDDEIAERAHRALCFLTNTDPTVAPKKIKKQKKAKRSKKRRRKRSRKSRRKKRSKKTLKVERKDKDGKPHTRSEIWTQWWKINKRKKRKQWLVDGFRYSGFDISKLDIKNVWDITRSISGDDFTSYNAQRTMMRMTGRRVNSLAWSKADASFNWRRWVERRIRRLRAPAIPEELSTLKPKKT